MGKLTKAEARILTYAAQFDWLALWPLEVLPKRSMLDRLLSRGLLTRVKTPTVWAGYQVTDAGRAALSQEGGH